jgi:hypothetical protein
MALPFGRGGNDKGLNVLSEVKRHPSVPWCKYTVSISDQGENLGHRSSLVMSHSLHDELAHLICTYRLIHRTLVQSHLRTGRGLRTVGA